MMVSSIRQGRIKAEQYISKEKIGAGQFGEVQKCQHKQSSKIYAIKTILTPRLFMESIQEEARNMLKASSEYVLQLVDYFYDDSLGAYILVTPYYKLGSVETLMTKSSIWEYEELLLFFYQISKALFDLSKSKILHLDLKPQNILIKGPGQYVLCDLGCSRKLENNNMSMTRSINVLKMSSATTRGGGTPEYASPDLVLNNEMTDFSDIWSLGVILYKIVYKRHPLTITMTNLDNQMNSFYNGTYKISYSQNEEYKKFKPIVEIVKRMLVCSKDKEKRITWLQILEQIYQLGRIQSHQTEHVVTNFDALLQFGDKISIITSSVLHYIDKLTQHLQPYKINTSRLTKYTCIFVLTLTHQILQHTQIKPYEKLKFYLFQTTRKNITKKQKSHAEYLKKQAIKLANMYNINLEYGAFDIARQALIKEYTRLSGQLKKIPQPEAIIEQIQFNKLLKIITFLGDQNDLKYQKRKDLNDQVAKLINN